MAESRIMAILGEGGMEPMRVCWSLLCTDRLGLMIGGVAAFSFLFVINPR